MPLPCSPVSNSTASEASERSPPTSDDSDDSLTTPRPGPADESKRTASDLSRPSVPPFSTSPANRARDGSATTWLTPAHTTSAESQYRVAGQSAALLSNSARSRFSEGRASLDSQGRKQSVTWMPQTAPPRPSSESSYVSHFIMTTSGSPSRSPHSTLRNRMSRDVDEVAADSSADENTAIMRKHGSSNKLNYGAAAVANANGNEVEQDVIQPVRQAESPQRRRKAGSIQSKRQNRTASLPAQGQDPAEGNAEVEHEGWFRSLVDKYGSVELENKGSVARDHLALERTFLAWLRTSLSFASIGIAVTQLFRLNTTIASSHPDAVITFATTSRLRSVGKPLGATFLGISILILLLGFHRYFESQHYVIRGKFPASRGTIILVSAVATALIVASLIVVVAVAPQAFEKK